jgi:predicted RNA-binding protein with PIN domain
MHYLIDGHNLIPKLPGLDLRLMDDEMRLVTMLQEYCRRSRNQVEVYFDNAPLGYARRHKYGTVVAHFIPQGRTADDAIRDRLVKLGNGARNWTVVSSDQRVLMDARAAHAQTVPSEKFARDLPGNLDKSADMEKPADEALSPEELAAWMKEFSGGNKKPKR